MKHCSKCLNELPLDQFYCRGGDRPGQYDAWCKPCKAAQNRERMWHRTIAQYGVDAEWYERTLAEQGGGCAICGETEAYKRGGRTRRLPVDHDHETGQARAILCDACNHAIGHVRENPDIAIGVAMYLIQHGKVSADGVR